MTTSQGFLSMVSMQLMLDALKTALAGAKIHLFSEVDTPPGEFSKVADFTEATFDGYAAVTVAAWNVIGSDQDGVPYIANPIAAFTYTGTPPDQVCPGAWVDHGVGPTDVDLSGLFESGFAFTPTNLVCNVMLKIREDGKVILLTLEDLQL